MTAGRRPFDPYRVAAQLQDDVLAVVCPERRCKAPRGALCSTGHRRGYHVPRFRAALEAEFGDLGGHADGQDDEPTTPRRRPGRAKRVPA